MTPHAFIAKWKPADLSERSAYQQHFIDLCRLLDQPTALRGYLAGKPVGGRVWGGTWARDKRGAEMMRGDLTAAGIPYAVDGPDGPLYADFHVLRHSYLTLGGRSGIDLRTL